MGDPKNMQMTAHLAWLAETQRRNRELFGGWFMEAGAGAGGEGGDAGGAGGAGDAGAGAAAGVGAAGGADAGNGGTDAGAKPPWGDDANFNPEKAWGLIQNLRKEKSPNAELQAELDTLKTTQQAQLDAVTKALGLKPDDTPPDPAKLAAQIETEKAATRAANVQLAVFKAAPAHEANATRLLDSSSFLASIKDVDPADTEALGAKIKAAVEADPVFKAGTSGSPTPPFPGGPRPTPSTRAGSLGEAIAARLASQTKN